MQVHNIHEAKTHLSMLIQRALRGEEIIIAKSGEPLIQLVPVSGDPQKRKGGQLKGMFEMSDDFDAPLPDDLQNLFEGK